MEGKKLSQTLQMQDRLIPHEIVKWVKVIVRYEGVARNSYHVDCGKVDRAIGYDLSGLLQEHLMLGKELGFWEPYQKQVRERIHRAVSPSALDIAELQYINKQLAELKTEIEEIETKIKESPTIDQEIERITQQLTKDVQKMVIMCLDKNTRWKNASWADLEVNLGLQIKATVEDDGEKEEWCECWEVIGERQYYGKSFEN